MERQLDELARRLQAFRRHGNKLTLEYVLESARILTEAKAIAKSGFGGWLRDKARMDRETARRHLYVAQFVKGNASLTSKIATLGIAKTYALSALDSVTARKYLTGEARFSAPLDQLSDVQFRKEFRVRFPGARKRRTRAHVFRALLSALIRASRLSQRFFHPVHKLTPSQRRRIVDKIRLLGHAVSEWKIVA